MLTGTAPAAKVSSIQHAKSGDPGPGAVAPRVVNPTRRKLERTLEPLAIVTSSQDKRWRLQRQDVGGADAGAPGADAGAGAGTAGTDSTVGAGAAALGIDFSPSLVIM